MNDELTQHDGGAQGDTGNAGGEAGQASWLDTLPDDLKGNEDLKAFKDPAEVAKALLETKAKLPVAPETADAYQLAIPDGIKVDDSFVAEAKAWAHKAGMSQGQFEAFAQPYMEAQRQYEQQVQQAEQAAIDGLRKEWGPKFDENLTLTKATIKRFGGEDLAQFVETSRMGNNAAFVKAWFQVGKAISEDKLIEGDGARVPGEIRLTAHGTPIMAEYPDMRK
jgi:hypothetical protein